MIRCRVRNVAYGLNHPAARPTDDQVPRSRQPSPTLPVGAGETVAHHDSGMLERARPNLLIGGREAR